MPVTGNIILLDTMADGSTGNPTLGTVTNIENLAGTDNAMTRVGTGWAVGATKSREVWIGRVMVDGSVSAVVNAGGSVDDTYARMYEFSGVATGATMGAIAEGPGQQNGSATTTLLDADAVPTGTNKLAFHIVVLDAPIAVAAFTGGALNWPTPAASFVSSDGTGAALALQIMPMPSAGTVGGGSQTIATASYHCLTYDFIGASGMANYVRAGAGAAITGASGIVELLTAVTAADTPPIISGRGAA